MRLAAQSSPPCAMQLDVPTQVVIYPGQFHGLTTPSYAVDRFKRYLDWFAKWMGNG